MSARPRQGPGAAPRDRLHALRNALIPVVTTIGLQVGMLLAGAILTETIFSWPGVGKWMVDSISKRDYPAVQGGLLLIAAIVMRVNLIVDVLYASSIPDSARPLRPWRTKPSGARPPRLLAEFWYYFRENRGAVLGLVIIVVVALACFAPAARRTPHAPTSSFASTSCARRLGRGRLRRFLPRHRRGRPRHPLPPDLRRPLLAADRRSSSSRSRSAWASCSVCSPASIAAGSRR